MFLFFLELIKQLLLSKANKKKKKWIRESLSMDLSHINEFIMKLQ